MNFALNKLFRQNTIYSCFQLKQNTLKLSIKKFISVKKYSN